MAAYGGKVRLVIKNYPYKYRDYSHIAAEASLAARDQNKFWKMHDLLLKKSPELDRNSLIKYAQEIGLDVKKFTDSIDKMKHSSIINTLDEVIEFFNDGGGKGNKALKPLGLSAEEKKSLKAFLTEALAGEEITLKYPEIP